MKIISKEIHIDTRGEDDMIDLTDHLTEALSQTGLKDGLLTIFIPGSTAALTTIEYEPGLKVDFPYALERLAPNSIPYKHEETWHDGNGHSHVKASIIGPSLTIPFKDSQMTLGTWQQPILLELDIHSRSRRLIIQMMGE
ncbi:MAG: secondary thiamine-phosphate synthase enzyme YjbQ [Nitrososphaerales archaeon]